MDELDHMLLANPPTISPELMKLIEIESGEILESFRWLATQLLQVATVLSVANVTVLGFAVTNSQAGLFLIGAGITTILLIAYKGGMTGAVPLLCRLVALEDLIESALKTQLETGVSIVLLNILGPIFLDEAREVNKISHPVEKRNAMKKLEKEMFIRGSTGKGTLTLILAIVVQLVLIPMLIHFYQWNFL